MLRTIVRCNWKIYLENINDTVHPMATHESAVAAARAVWGERPVDAEKPMAMEQILPFGAPFDFFDRMGARVYPNGHSVLGTKHSIHSGYGKLPDYEAAMHAAYGAARRALARLGRLTLTVRVVVTPPSGAPFRATKTVKLKR